METLPTEIVLNEILSKIDQVTSLSYLMATPKYRHLVESNINKYFPISNRLTTKELSEIVRKNEVITLARLLINNDLNNIDLLNIIMDTQNVTLLEKYKSFIKYNYRSNNDTSRKISSLLGRYANSKIRDIVDDDNENYTTSTYDSTNQILKILLEESEEYILYTGLTERNFKEEVYRDMFLNLMDVRLYETCRFILSIIYVSVDVLSIITRYDDLDTVKYAMERYIQDGGSYNDIDYYVILENLFTNPVGDRYVYILDYLFSLPIKYDYSNIYNETEANGQIDDDVKQLLLSYIPQEN
ncbi:Hypothetical protein ORPV_269 [Orpheovirus IHUMI-LCC2]|uniref:Uncharacterized protein n=1 Tax=Orpheovirus IHUMI-LCC2 TaxID=2023057 RepID=A0A2I2L3S0_9VIRU|nr:Hypothetical protein ORPV_269 [Orpheovirus IHUMI-LCC2]SNW62173.1 Hypothetical protein ORPV_269 [Orpheovirus IHUMI-LCC2]